MENKLNKLAPKIKVTSDNEIFIDEFMDYLGNEVIREIKVTMPKDNCHTRGRVVTLGMKGGKPNDSKELW